jgi:hypothetical protein
MDYRIISIRVTYYFCKSPPYQNTANIPPAPAESITPTLLGLSNPPAPLLYNRLPHRPFIIIPNTVTAAYPPIFRLADRQIRSIVFPRQRDQLPLRI